MTLKKSNPHLKVASARKVALRVSAKSSSAVEGIHAPFADGKRVIEPKSTKSLVTYWKRRVAAKAR